jgi:hypothetical protein
MHYVYFMFIGYYDYVFSNSKCEKKILLPTF